MFPPRRDVGYDWALDRAHLWRNGVEHLERSAELCGRAVVDNENEEGETKLEVISAGMERSGMKAEANTLLPIWDRDIMTFDDEDHFPQNTPVVLGET